MATVMRAWTGTISPKSIAVLLALFLLALMPGCTTNPATGDQSFTALLPADEEAALGAREHPKILAQFGGEYDDPEIAAYVDDIGQRLAALSERPDVNFTFTVLDSPIVNAFAVPGGYIYVSRGLVALADNEAELAGVIGHEIGHVTARHSAQRISRNALLGMGAALFGAAIGDSSATQLLNMGAAAIAQGYSREAELEADMLGIRYLSRGGYDTRAMGTFLGKLGEIPASKLA